ncbi:MAG TPA: decaprenyl-phosphate phosphoribosyltransferase [Pseudonocardiaceae bacterium]|nr:decaprenyl-phosphate phosphoribosyltransferase [Pseudonocardiaceae bacterium]
MNTTLTACSRSSARTPLSVGLGLIRAARPRQWVKNVLVAAAPFAGGALLDPHVLAKVGSAFAAFSLAASAVYLLNDTVDMAADQAHPTKSRRPIASGVVPPVLAITMSVILLAAALVVAALAAVNLVIVIAIYAVVQLAYCLWLKYEPVIDICVVASGFLMRAIAGGTAVTIALSPWFLLSAAFGSLFMVAGKRYAEIRLHEETGAQIRKSLERYSASYLRFVWGMSATVLITTYGLWAFENLAAHHHSVWSVISMVPFVMAVLRYAVEVDRGGAGEPEEIALGDRVLQVLAVAWVATLILTIYV